MIFSFTRSDIGEYMGTNNEKIDEMNMENEKGSLASVKKKLLKATTTRVVIRKLSTFLEIDVASSRSTLKSRRKDH